MHSIIRDKYDLPVKVLTKICIVACVTVTKCRNVNHCLYFQLSMYCSVAYQALHCRYVRSTVPGKVIYFLPLTTCTRKFNN